MIFKYSYISSYVYLKLVVVLSVCALKTFLVIMRQTRAVPRVKTIPKSTTTAATVAAVIKILDESTDSTVASVANKLTEWIRFSVVRRIKLSYCLNSSLQI